MNAGWEEIQLPESWTFPKSVKSRDFWKQTLEFSFLPAARLSLALGPSCEHAASLKLCRFLLSSTYNLLSSSTLLRRVVTCRESKSTSRVQIQMWLRCTSDKQLKLLQLEKSVIFPFTGVSVMFRSFNTICLVKSIEANLKCVDQCDFHVIHVNLYIRHQLFLSYFEKYKPI